jgi:hypothetical protein
MAYQPSSWTLSNSPGNNNASRDFLNNMERGIEDANAFLGNSDRIGSSWGMWEDLRFDANALKAAGVKDPSYTTCIGGGVRAYWFSPTTQEELYFAAQFPHAWDGSAIYPHVHWFDSTGSSTKADKVQWGLEYSWAEIGSTMSAPTTVFVATRTPDEAIVSNKHYISSFPPITPTANQDGISSMMLCRLFRDSTVVADSSTNGAYLLEIDFHYRMNMIGSRQELSK